MISSPTVLILGAGASASYGFPLGRKFVHMIANELREGPVQKCIDRAYGSGHILPEFTRRLTEAHVDSIDAFLEMKPDGFVNIGKAAIALTILNAEARCAEKGLLNSETVEDDWMRYVWKKLQAGASADTFALNRLSVITYNYDRSLEEYLVRRLQAQYGLDVEPAGRILNQAVRIVHVHGVLGVRAFGLSLSKPDVERTRALAECIQVIHDPFAEGDARYAEAHALLREAQRVCFIGFGFHPTNAQRLKLKTELTHPTVKVYASRFGLGDGDIESAEACLGVGMIWGEERWQNLEFLRQRVPLEKRGSLDTDS